MFSTPRCSFPHRARLRGLLYVQAREGRPRRRWHRGRGFRCGTIRRRRYGLFDLDALLLEAEPLDIAGDADGEDDAVDGEFPVSPGFARRAVMLSSSAVQALHRRPGVDGHALLGEGLACERGVSASSAGRMRSSISTTVTSAPRARVDTSRTRRRWPGADDDHRLAAASRAEQRAVGVTTHVLAVRLEARQAARRGAPVAMMTVVGLRGVLSVRRLRTRMSLRRAGKDSRSPSNA